MTPNHGGTHGTSEEPMGPHRHPWDSGDTHRTPNHWGHPGALKDTQGTHSHGGHSRDAQGTLGAPMGPLKNP